MRRHAVNLLNLWTTSWNRKMEAHSKPTCTPQPQHSALILANLAICLSQAPRP